MDTTRLKKIIENAGYDPKPYSGRWMRGLQCVSITTDDSTYDVLANLIENSDDVDGAAEIVRLISQDSMGMGVVLYWPRAKWVEGV